MPLEHVRAAQYHERRSCQAHRIDVDAESQHAGDQFARA
jgi:hypothetical protein